MRAFMTVFGRVVGALCRYDEGRGKGWGLNGVEKGMTWRWKMTRKEVLAEAGASFFGGCWKMRERGDFVVILELGLQKGLQKGVTLDGERGYKKWK